MLVLFFITGFESDRSTDGKGVASKVHHINDIIIRIDGIRESMG
jgi:hypothetical protein